VARIVSVYRTFPKPADLAENRFVVDNMSYLRWFKLADALTRRGHQVEMAVPDAAVAWRNPFGLPQVALSRVDWRTYDAIKTDFHRGFETLEKFGGADHPLIISKLGSVVGPEDRSGIYFYGPIREHLYQVQERLHRKSRVVAVLNDRARQLLAECHGHRDNVLCVPGAADRDWPEPGPDPYPEPRAKRKRVLFAGNVYTAENQPEANHVLVSKLNRLGHNLRDRGTVLYMMGPGDLEALDRRYVHYLGSVPHHRTPDYFHHADAGVVVAAGEWHHNNESTKIYHYLRAGLPVVTESGFPNEFLVHESGLGFVAPAGRMDLLADKLVEATHSPWDRRRAIDYILASHTWDRRAAIYDSVLGAA
jgi:hypothetical protein